MEPNDRIEQGFVEALKKLGGRSALARLCKVTRQSVQQWNRIPDRHVRTVARQTGIPLRRLRPDLYDARFYGSQNEPLLELAAQQFILRGYSPD